MAAEEAVMVRTFGKAHLAGRRTLARVKDAVLLGLVGSGLLACMLGASVYDLGRLFSAW